MSRHLALRGAVGAGIALLVAAGCTSPVPAPEPGPKPSDPVPVLTGEQDQRVLDAVGAAVAEADAAKDPALLEPRVTGPALAMRTAQIQVAAGLGAEEVLRELPTEVEQMVIPTTQDWPRTSYAVTVRPSDQGSNRLFAFDQDSARDQYKLWGWVQIYPGTSLPALAAAEKSSPAVAPDDASSLLMAPADAVAQYVDVLTMGADSTFAASFTPDQFAQTMVQAREAQVQAAATANGTFTSTFAVDAGQPVHAVATSDGGALVMGALTQTDSIAIEEGGTLDPSSNPAIGLFLAGAPVANVLNTSYLVTIAMYVPPAGSADPVQILGVERQLVAASP